MANSLDNKLKNDYSTKYVLVLDESAYYPLGTDQEKIATSNTVPTIPTTKTDPFRQAMGKMWTFEQGVGATVRFYDPYIAAPWFPNGGNTDNQVLGAPLDLIEGQTFAPGNYYLDNTSIRYFDVSDVWSQVMEDVPTGMVHLRRKATRMALKFDTNKALQAQFTMISLVSDIAKKNQTPAYSPNTTENDFGLKLPELTQSEELLESLKEQLEETKAQIGPLSYEQYMILQIYKFLIDTTGNENLQGTALEYLAILAYLGSITIPEIAEYFADAGVDLGEQDIVDFFVSVIFAGFNQSGGMEEWGNFGNYYEDLIAKINDEIQANEDAISSLEDTIEEYETVIIPDLEKQNEEYIQSVISEYTAITFPGAGTDANYNYWSELERSTVFAEKAPLLDPFGSPQSDEVKAQFDNTFNEVALYALNDTIEKSHMDAFYDFVENDYKYNGDAGGYTRRYYEDSVFSMPLPMSSKAQALVNEADKSSMYVDFKSTYNFYSKYYEKVSQLGAVENSQGTTTVLPSTYFPSIYEIPLEEDPTNPANPAPSADDNNSKFSFEKFGHNLLNCKLAPTDLSNVVGFDKYFNIIIAQNNKEYLAKYDTLKNKFPFYIEFELKVDESKEFSTAFNNSSITAALLKTFISNFFYSRKQGTMNIEPSKNNLIRDLGAEGAFQYYDPEDPESPPYADQGQVVSDPVSAPICMKNIYRIKSKKDFYKLVSPTTTAYSEIFDNHVDESPQYNVRQINLNRWLEEFGPGLGNPEFDNDIMGNDVATSCSKVLSSNESEVDFLEYLTSDPSMFIKNIAALMKYKELVDEKSRNYHQILGKEESYNETLFYRIQKVEIDNSGYKSLAQNTWMIKPDGDTENDLMKYIDTQVRYGKKYEFTVYAYQLVVGTKYGFQFENSTNFLSENLSLAENGKFQSYLNSFDDTAGMLASNLPFTSTFDLLYRGPHAVNRLWAQDDASGEPMQFLAMFDVICEPDVKIVEMPLYKKEVTISDAPPMFPEVDIVPLRGRDNDIKINFYPGSVNREIVPIAIESLTEDTTDNDKFLKIRNAQDRTLLKQQYAGYMSIQQDTGNTMFVFPPHFYVEPKLKFKSDDFVTHYQIYRLDYAPEKYLDFGGNRLLTINSQNQSSYTDMIEQNKKYYYMFRSVDVHENVSNPSPVYQVEMVENSGAVYPVVSIYNFEQQGASARSKSFKRYIKISPSEQQNEIRSSLDPEEHTSAVYENNNVKFGPSMGDNTIKGTGFPTGTGKKFKIRLRSKHTGKIVDLNIQFEARKQTTNENIPSCGDENYVEYNMSEAGSSEMHEGAGSDNNGNDDTFQH